MVRPMPAVSPFSIFEVDSMRKKICWLLLLTVIVLFAAVLFVGTQRREYPKSEFEYNKWEEPYSQGIPLDEMNFNVYRNYVALPVALTDSVEFVREVKLPCDVCYYAHKEDSEPIIVLEKGLSVYVIPANRQYFGPPGYGLECWPDYQKGWRYGQPFVTDESETSSYDAQKYYVRTSELEAVAKAFYQANSRLYRGQVSAARYALVVTREIDVLLYKNGAFCSEELY